MRLRRREREPRWVEHLRTVGPDGLTGYEVERLARYNTERERGIVHTAEWQAEMAELQARFNTANQGCGLTTIG